MKQLVPSYIEIASSTLSHFQSEVHFIKNSKHTNLFERKNTTVEFEFTEIAEVIRRGLLHGSGLVFITGDNLTELTDFELKLLHIRIGQHLGSLRRQNRMGDVIIDVKNTDSKDQEATRGFLTNSSMKLHTDGWDAAGLMCLQQSEFGGQSQFMSSEDLFELIKIENPKLATRLAEDWYWDIRVLGDDETLSPIKSPIFCEYEGRVSCRYGSYMLRNGWAALGKEMPKSLRGDLQSFEKYFQRKELVYSHRLKRGQAVWMNNRSILHGRTNFKDGKESELIRKMVRLWIIVNDSRNLPEDFYLFDEKCFVDNDNFRPIEKN